ncbi:MAG: Type 1 glutamine amidotransferase-like domain-containing protein [Clostridiales bacterium]|nr:Type 1 glutamine amidotransferase-like domain-containing protein [Clostridiales bacterium]
MRKQLIGLFSGFPDRHFPEEIVARLKAELPVRKSLVFISAWPEEYERNDEDSDGMHAMFEEVGLPFEKHCVIDDRTSPSEAAHLVQAASCIFLMGGNATAQMSLIREKDIADAIKDSDAVLFGVSAGSMNLGKTTIDIWESMEPYEGLGMANITILSHFDTADEERHERVLAASKIHPVCAMDDLSAIFVKEGRVDTVGTIHHVEDGNIRLLDADLVKELESEKRNTT